MTGYRPLDLKMHARIDLMIAISGFLAPWLLGFAADRAATTYTLAIAAFLLVLSLVTDYPLGILRLVPFRWNQFIAWLSPPLVIMLPWMKFAGAGLMPWYLTVMGFAILLNSALTREQVIHGA
jgi:hypothetical protein